MAKAITKMFTVKITSEEADKKLLDALKTKVEGIGTRVVVKRAKDLD